MSFLKRKSFILTAITFVSVVLFSIIGLIIFDNTHKSSKSNFKFHVNDLSQYSDYFTMSYRPVSSDENFIVQAANGVDDVMNTLIKKMLWTLADSNNSKFTIYSESDLKFYTSATHIEVPNYSEPRQGAYLEGTSVVTYTYYDKVRPIDYCFNVLIQAGTYLVDVYVDDSGQMMGRYVTVNRNWEGPYQCELVLMKDITVDVNSFQPFCQFEGIFNGNGHTITCSGQRTIKNSNDFYNTDSSGMFFAYTFPSAIIKNTKFKNISLFMDAFSVKYTGGIVGYNSGTLQTCWVESVTFKSNRYQKNCTVAPLAGLNSGSVTDCMVTGSYILEGQGINFGNPDGLKACYFVTYRDPNSNTKEEATIKSLQATKCTYNVTVYKYHTSDGNKNFIISPSDWDDLPSDCYSSNSDAFSSLDVSSAGGTDGGSVWYYVGSSYNSNWPMLRVFILLWTKIDIKSEDTNKGTVSRDVVELPSNASGMFGSFNNSTSQNISLLGQSVTANPASGYVFSKWIYSSNTYTATFTDRVCKVRFHDYLGDEVREGCPTDVVVSLETDYTVAYGTTIYVKTTPYFKEGYKEVRIWFVDINFEWREIIYFIPKENKSHYIYGCYAEIVDYGHSHAGASLDIINGLDVFCDIEISVKATQKTYKIEFK